MAIATEAIAETVTISAVKALGRRPKTPSFTVDCVDRFAILLYTPNTSKKASSSS